MLIKRLERLLQLKIVENTVLFFLLLGVTITIFTPNISIFKTGAELANQSMLAYLGLSLFFLIFNQKRLMIVAMICTCIFAFYLKETTDARIRYSSPNQEEKLRISLINLTSFDTPPNKVLKEISDKDFDFIIFQEYTPNWKGIISKLIGIKYRYQVAIPRIDFYGIKIFSKYPINKVDTFFVQNALLLKTQIQKNHRNFDIVTTYLAPSIDSASSASAQEQLNLLSKFSSTDSIPLIVAGIFNLVPWCSEIQNFKKEANLIEARRGYLPTMHKNTDGIFAKPVTHFFYNARLECNNFKISSFQNDEIGIEAKFQIKSDKVPEAKPFQ